MGEQAEYINQTTVHPAGLAVVLIISAYFFLAPRHIAPLAFIVMACLVSSAQRLVIAGLDFNFIRVLVLVGALRVLSRAEYKGFRMLTVDWLMLAWGLVSIVVFTLQWGAVSAFITICGKTFEALGVYFICRALFRNMSDLRAMARAMALIVIPVCGLFLVEKLTGRNPFAALGGVPEVTLVRDGRLRCQGPFSHAILAGCFWAALIPMMAALFWESGIRKFQAVVGCACAVAIIYFCASSTPVLALLVVFAGATLLPLRLYLSQLRWMTVAMIFTLHMVMIAPVWHLIARVSAVGGSTGWHRYHLIDSAIERFPEWAILGTRSTAHWGWGLQDITNQYVLEGVRGGFLRLALFIAIVALCFRSVGRAWRMFKPYSPNFMMAWAVGVSLAVHCVSFIGVSYFGQITMLWYFTLAMAANLEGVARASLPRRPAKRKPQPERGRTMPVLDQA
ncbi:MAG: hypothetical protein RIB58_10220 [Phycisphaerales bacterium]